MEVIESGDVGMRGVAGDWTGKRVLVEIAGCGVGKIGRGRCCL